MVLMLSAAPNASQRLLVPDAMYTDPFVPLVTYQDTFGNLCTRLEAPPRKHQDQHRWGYQFARCTKTALETYHERQGVCRDLAHLAISFCRALSIPARYATGYLGDIGVPAVDAPMDFAGCMEVFLDGGWHTFDPRNNARRIGRLMIARGRDAADVAISTAFGPSGLRLFKVWTDEISDQQAAALLAQSGVAPSTMRAA
jgi:hypothetical protein